jgi:Tol biopolymer transport system component
LYRVAFESANLLRMSLVTAAAMLAICLLALVQTANTVEATPLLRSGKIVFSSLRDRYTSFNIYTIEPDGSSLSRLTHESTIDVQPAWSPDGKKITFAGGGLYVLDADGSNVRAPTSFVCPGSSNVVSPTWSPDGTQVAFGGDTLPSDICTTELASGYQTTPTNVTSSPEVHETSPDLSPNGSQMCYYGNSTKSGYGIYIMNADGSDPTRLTDNRAGPECAWSPDGTKIAYAYHPDKNPDRSGGTWPDEVYVMNADGSGKTNLTRNPAQDFNPSWSPDGTKITFASDRDGDIDIYKMDADGSDVAHVTTNSGVDDVDPDWQPLPPKSDSVKVHPPDTGGPSLLLVASALFFSGGSLLYAGVRRRM